MLLPLAFVLPASSLSILHSVLSNCISKPVPTQRENKNFSKKNKTCGQVLQISLCRSDAYPVCGLVWFLFPFVIKIRSYTYFSYRLYSTLVYSEVPVLLLSHFSFAAFQSANDHRNCLCLSAVECIDALKQSLADGTCHVFFFIQLSSFVWPTSTCLQKPPGTIAFDVQVLYYFLDPTFQPIGGLRLPTNFFVWQYLPTCWYLFWKVHTLHHLISLPRASCSKTLAMF